MSREKLSEAARGLGKHLDELLHVEGECTCYNEGTCEWCRDHCLQCGATRDQHPVQEKGEDPHDFQTLCLCVGDVLCDSCSQGLDDE
jgi:hypothetical protein